MPPMLLRKPAVAFALLVISAIAGTAIQITKLLPDDGAATDWFGFSVAVSGDTAVIGAARDADLGSRSGSAYVFVRNGDSWIQQDKLLPEDGETNDEFGHSVSVSGDTAVIGAWGFLQTDLSAAYVFVREGRTWSQQAKLVAADGALDDQFARSVAVSGDTAVIGARAHDAVGNNAGAAYVFVRNNGIWTQQDKLLADDGVEGDFFGDSVALSGDTAVIGAAGQDALGNASGAAYVFVRSGDIWSQQDKLLADDGEAGDSLGGAVAVSGDTAVIISPQTGRLAYVFVRNGNDWAQQAKLLPDDVAEHPTFAISAAVSGDRALFGALDSELAAGAGAAYVFERNGANWTQQAKLFADDGAQSDQFGDAVALSGGTAVIGARRNDDLGNESGSAYVMSVTRFLDVPSEYWAFDFIETLAKAGVTSGCGGGNYCPEDSVTRAQMAVFLERGMKGSDYVPPAASGIVFNDVAASDFAANFIEQLYSDGITAGCGNDNYCPDAEVTRAQMAVFLLRAKYGSGYAPPAATGIFNDVDLGYWAVHWIEQLAAEGITAGCGNNNYCPEAPVTRAQMAVFLVRTFGL